MSVNGVNIQRLSDTLEIQALMYKYASAVDARDWTAWREVFTEDAVVDYTSAGMISGTRDEVAEWLANVMAMVPMSQHLITNIEADVTGDIARVRAMFYNPMQLPGKDDLSFCGGYYHHSLVRTEAGWRSRELREENLWFANPIESV